ncbi:MAG TPA: DEAD/DEAH box helicase, partial [bacterium]|nr:DEAD/DEAH box helicase [bacterium]
MTGFEDLKLIDPLLKAVKTEGYESPTPIQEQAIPIVVTGRDLLGCAQTGTGKTAAFALPILQRLYRGGTPEGKRPIRALTLTPTRELAAQIGESFSAYGRHTGLRCAVVFGGVGQAPQAAALRRGVDILVATPGRLLDLVYQGLIDFGALEVFVLDEADRMLDMGFITDVQRIVSLLPEKRQTLFFSATMPAQIRSLANNILNDPEYMAVAPPCSTVEMVDQSAYFVEKPQKPDLLAHLFKNNELRRVLIFTRTKYGADKVARHLTRNRVRAAAIHGDKTQNARTAALDAFKRGRVRALVATDIASRGIDVEDVTHVINYDLPNEPDSYVHRIGRTARAGAEGAAISFCDSSERAFLADIERTIRMHGLVTGQDDLLA